MTTTRQPSFSRAFTHEVANQPPPLVDYDIFASDRALADAVTREGAAWAVEELGEFGRLMGRADTLALGALANDNTPVLRTHDRYGYRIDEVDFHPSWHALMEIAVRHRLHCLPWTEGRPGAHVARAAMMFIASQVEAGHGCPISMTYSVVPALQKQPEVAEEWIGRICSDRYDRRFLPAAEKTGVIVGMGMTEKQGGSDVRANSTRAVPVKGGGPGQRYLITGHKWFCSAPMSDAFLILAQAPGGLSCFLLPRWTPEGDRNRFFIQRLKSKLGNRSNASSEVEFVDADAWMVGEEGRGVPTIIEMVNHTRLDCVLSSAALMRQAVAQATHHALYRSAFGKRLTDQPLMKNVLADLAVESEAATVLAIRLARSFDRRKADKNEDAFRRIATAVSKYWVCKRAPVQVAEALECLGGNGYVEDFPMARLFRESPVNSIWEGSGNVICLDVLRAIRNEPDSVPALLGELESTAGADDRLDRHVERLKEDLRSLASSESSARMLVERMALALQASLLLRCAPDAVASAFLASRVGGEHGAAFGTLPAAVDADTIIERARPC